MQAHPRAPEFSRIPFQVRSYGVLAEVSLCCPPLKGRFPTFYSPVRHFPLTEVRFSFDLHVWSTPPAFVLSQDQTLHCQKVYDLHLSRDVIDSFRLLSLAFRLSLSFVVELTSLFRLHYSVFNVRFSVNSSMNPHQLINSFRYSIFRFNFGFVFANSLVITQLFFPHSDPL